MKRSTLVFGALAKALDDPASPGGWLSGLDIADRCGIRPGDSWPILYLAYERGDLKRECDHDPATPGHAYYRFMDAGIRRHLCRAARRPTALASLACLAWVRRAYRGAVGVSWLGAR